MKTLILFLCLACSLAAESISGQIFIATQGGQSYKLGAVNVVIFSASSVDAYMSAARPEYLAALKIIDEEEKRLWAVYKALPRDDHENKLRGLEKLQAQAELRDSKKAALYRNMRAEALLKTMSDADGRFEFSPPDTPYYIAATGSRKVGDKTERYVWLVPSSELTKPMLLTNTNMESWDD